MRISRFSLFLVYVVALSTKVNAFEIEDHRSYLVPDGQQTLSIISTADVNVFEPIIVAFQRVHPTINIDYVIAASSEIMKAIYDEGAPFDLAISSAMDLQTKIANDGFSLSYTSDATQSLPDWAKWRNQIFAFTQEPAVLIISQKVFAELPRPSTREDLINLLRDNAEIFDGNIGTYDVRKSGVGYLFATQDSRNTDSFWRLTEVMGRLNAKLYSGSGDMISDVADGRLALAYNVFGSYAASRLTDTPGFEIISLDDFTNVMLRTALIPEAAHNPTGAGMMIDFLASLGDRPDLTVQTSLPPINQETLAKNSAARPIKLGPGLLVFLDRLRKETFLRSWTSSIEQE